MQEFVDKIGASVVRTVVPVVVGLVISYALKVGLHIDAAWLTDIVTLGVTTAFYAGVRYLEVYVGQGWGWLLGLANAPKYSTPVTPGAVTQTADPVAAATDPAADAVVAPDPAVPSV